MAVLYFGAGLLYLQAQNSEIPWNEEHIEELNREAEELLEAQKFQEAIPFINQALDLSKRLNHIEGEAQATLNLARYYDYRGLPDSVITHIEAVNIDRFIDTDAATSLGNLLGTAYASVGEYQQGLELFLQMIDLAKQRNEEQMAMGITQNLGNTYNRLGDLPAAIESYLEALELAEQKNDTLVTAIVLDNLASLNVRLENYELAEEYLNQALQLNVVLNDIQNQIVNYISFGILYKEWRDFEKSLASYHKGLELTDEYDIVLHRVQILYNTGILHFEFQRYEEAMEYFSESYKLSMENNISIGLFFNQNAMGKAHAGMGNYTEALALLRSALQVAEQSGSIEHTQETLENLFTTSELNGDTTQAYEYLKRYNAVNDSLSRTRREEALARQEIVLGLRLERENRAALQTAYNNERRNFLIAAALLTLLIILFVITMLFYKNKQETSRQLQKKTDELMRANQVKDQLLSVLAHDLRTPLSNLHGVVYLIRNKIMEGANVDDALDDIEAKLRQGIGTLTNYLQWAQNQWEGMEADPEPLEAGNLIEAVIMEFASLIKQKNISISNEVTNDVKILADKQLFLVIFRNLLSNAIKFVRQNGKINIRAEQSADDVFISVEDNGVGMSRQKQQKLFEPFTSMENGTSGEPGTGLGLSICKDFAEKQGGKISVESAAGEGSSFVLTLKKA